MHNCQPELQINMRKLLTYTIISFHSKQINPRFKLDCAFLWRMVGDKCMDFGSFLKYKTTKLSLGSLFLGPPGVWVSGLRIRSWANFFLNRLMSCPGPALSLSSRHLFFISDSVFPSRAAHVLYPSSRSSPKRHPQTTVILLPSDFRYHIFCVPLICRSSGFRLLLTFMCLCLCFLYWILNLLSMGVKKQLKPKAFLYSFWAC